MASIEKIVSRNFVALDATAPCSEAARVMSERRIGSIGVRENGRVIGLVTERDLVSRVLGSGDPGKMPIREAMRQDLPSIRAEATETECAALMRDNHTRHLLVTHGGELVGVISMRDVIQLMLDEKQWLIEQLQRYVNSGG